MRRPSVNVGMRIWQRMCDPSSYSFGFSLLTALSVALALSQDIKICCATT
jgi:hypothetical protein